jgi:L-fucose mutarotase/ribose pyranase (RbsD/FucU family)
MAKISHKDDLVIGNNNFPAANMSACCLYCDCHGVPKLPDVILLHFLLDSLPGDPPT